MSTGGRALAELQPLPTPRVLIFNNPFQQETELSQQLLGVPGLEVFPSEESPSTSRVSTRISTPSRSAQQWTRSSDIADLPLPYRAYR